MKLPAAILGIISDLLLWSCVLGLLLFAGAMIFGWGDKKHQEQVLVLKFHDASQLQEGSPVHFMGTNIGYVSGVKPQKNHVEVMFKTYPGAMTIPKGSRFTIEFNGLVGAKTLEVLPPEEHHQEWGWEQDGYLVQDPIRLRDLFKTQVVMADALQYTSNNISRALGDVKDPLEYPVKIEGINRQIQQANQTMIRYFSAAQQQISRTHVGIANAAHMISSVTHAVNHVESMTAQPRFSRSVLGSLQGTTQDAQDFTTRFNSLQQGHQMETWQGYLQETSGDISTTQATLEQQIPRVMAGWCRFNCWLYDTDLKLGRAETYLQQHPLHESLLRIRQSVHNWTGQLNRYLVVPPPAQKP